MDKRLTELGESHPAFKEGAEPRTEPPMSDLASTDHH
jgi:hypothetical protein